MAAVNDASMSKSESDRAIKELKEQGYTVIPNVLSNEQCDRFIKEYKVWLKQFEDQGIEPDNRNSIIQSYRISHFQPTWEARLATKKVFTNIWGTEKLLTSADAVAISKPPEEGSGDFAMPNQDFLHLDQGVKRIGLHAYQSGLYLEEATSTDHCFRALSHSHEYHSEFYQVFPEAAVRSRRNEFVKLSDSQKEWYRNRGCVRTKIPVPKGGMVLWDSRTVHDNSKPVYGREHGDRWRFVVFVSMTPALWAKPKDLSKKQDAYDNMLITTHWGSQGIKTFKPYTPKKNEVIKTIDRLPDIARTSEARKLFGLERYNFLDRSSPNGPDPPLWGS